MTYSTPPHEHQIHNTGLTFMLLMENIAASALWGAGPKSSLIVFLRLRTNIILFSSSCRNRSGIGSIDNGQKPSTLRRSLFPKSGNVFFFWHAIAADIAFYIFSNTFVKLITLTYLIISYSLPLQWCFRQYFMRKFDQVLDSAHSSKHRWKLLFNTTSRGAIILPIL
jgi:hypothetical protein